MQPAISDWTELNRFWGAHQQVSVLQCFMMMVYIIDLRVMFKNLVLKTFACLFLFTLQCEAKYDEDNKFNYLTTAVQLQQLRMDMQI